MNEAQLWVGLVALTATALAAPWLEARRHARAAAPPAPGTAPPFRSADAPPDAREPPDPAIARARVATATWLGALVVLPLTPAWLSVASMGELLPVAFPLPIVAPMHASPTWDLGDLVPLWFVVIVAGLYAAGVAVARGMPMLLARSRARGASGPPAATTWLWRGACALALGALTLGAIQQATRLPAAAFHTYGALTPSGGAATRAAYDAVVRRNARAGVAPHALPRGAPVLGLTVDHPGSDCCGGFSHPAYTSARTGTLIWIAETPTLLTHDGPLGALVAHPVTGAGDGLRAQRAAFAAQPDVLPGRTGTGPDVLVGCGADGAPLALLVDGLGDHGAKLRNVAPLLRPPLWPLALVAAALLVAIAWVQQRRSGGLEAGVARAAGAWLVLESVAALFVVYGSYT